MTNRVIPSAFSGISPQVATWISTLAALVPICWLLIHGQFGILAFLCVFFGLAILISINRPVAICIILAYLFLLGDVRRILGTFIGFPKLDPQIMVCPAISFVLALPALMQIRLKDSISKAILGLMVIMTLEIANPRQGPITVGLGGALFYLGPLLWFWVGRKYGTFALLEMVIYRTVIPLAVLEAILGLYQTYVGFLPWQSVWIAAVADHYHSLQLGNGFIRAFGFSVNGAEYAGLLLIGTTAVLAAFFAGKRTYGLLFPILGVTLFLASSRSAIVKLIFAVSISWALSSRGGKGWALRLPLGIVCLVGVLVFSLSHASVGDSTLSAANASAKHQVEGLSHPLDSTKSTAGLHASMFLSGFQQGLSYPIGSGLGAVTLGSTRLGGADAEVSGSTEVDISDAFISMGLPGGLLYLFTIGLIIRRALIFGRTAPRHIGLPTIAILAAMGGTWVALGQYGSGPLVWFLVGFLAQNGVAPEKSARTVARQKAPSALPRETFAA